MVNIWTGKENFWTGRGKLPELQRHLHYVAAMCPKDVGFFPSVFQPSNRQSPALYTREFEGSPENKNLFIMLLSVSHVRGALLSQGKTESLLYLYHPHYLQQCIKIITTTKH